MRTEWWTSVAGLALVVTACNEQSSDPLAAGPTPSELHFGLPDITGSVLGPDGTSICNFVPEGTAFVVQAIEASLQIPGNSAFPTCPASDYNMPVNPGTYYLRAQFASTDGIGTFPWRTLTPVPITLDAADVIQDVIIDQGTPVGGRATLDGRPIEGISFGVAYDVLPLFGAAFGASGSDGSWTDFFGRAPLVLQSGLTYSIPTLCEALLGTAVVEGFPAGPFNFPGGLDELNCALRSGATEPLTHNFGRVAVTAMPGDFGGLSPDIDPRFGQGYGVQFPVVPGAAPAHLPLFQSHLFRGGLLVGLESGVILAGFDAGGGALQCGATCHDLGLDGKVAVNRSPVLGKRITWRYTDAPSAEGVGLEITQRSYDAPAGGGYVLFRFEVRNRSAGPQRLSLGLFTDWDVDDDPLDDIGFTERGGGLLFQANTEGPSTRAGTLVVGDTPPTGGFFFSGQFVPSLSDQAAALAGTLSEPASGAGDLRYIQSIAPVELRRGRMIDFWVAIVMGADEADFGQNAEAALRDIETHRRVPAPVAERGQVLRLRFSEIRPAPGGGSGRLCKGECLK